MLRVSGLVSDLVSGCGVSLGLRGSVVVSDFSFSFGFRVQFWVSGLVSEFRARAQPRGVAPG